MRRVGTQFHVPDFAWFTATQPLVDLPVTVVVNFVAHFLGTRMNVGIRVIAVGPVLDVSVGTFAGLTRGGRITETVDVTICVVDVCQPFVRTAITVVVLSVADLIFGEANAARPEAALNTNLGPRAAGAIAVYRLEILVCFPIAIVVQCVALLVGAGVNDILLVVAIEEPSFVPDEPRWAFFF